MSVPLSFCDLLKHVNHFALSHDWQQMEMTHENPRFLEGWLYILVVGIFRFPASYVSLFGSLAPPIDDYAPAKK